MILTQSKHTFDKNIFEQYTKAIIVGKGPTFKPVAKPDDYTILIGINHATAHLTDPDMMVAQDIEVWSQIPAAVNKLSFAVTPTYPHEDCRFKRNTTYKKVIHYLEKAKFDGIYIPYNGLNSSMNDFIEIPKYTTLSSGNAAVGFVSMFMPNVKKITTYGMCAGKNQSNNQSWQGHSDIFKKCSIARGYTWAFNNRMRSSLTKITRENNIILNIL